MVKNGNGNYTRHPKVEYKISSLYLILASIPMLAGKTPGLGGSKVDSAFHHSEVNKMSTRDKVFLYRLKRKQKTFDFLLFSGGIS